MYRTYTETLPGVKYRDSTHSITCASDFWDVGDYTVFITADYDRPFSDVMTNPVPRMIIDKCREMATPALLDDIFSAETDSGDRLFAPVIETACDFIKEKDGQMFTRKRSVAAVVVDKITKEAKFAAWGNVHLMVFDKEYQDYEFIWPRFKGTTEMYGALELSDRCNLLLANDTMFCLLYNKRTDCLYRLYEDMMLNDLDSGFNLKALNDLTYIITDLSCPV